MSDTLSMTRGPEYPPVRDITMGQLLREVAEQCPERAAMITGVPAPDERRTWTYSELYADALTVARALLTKFKPGERIAVWAPNIPEWILLEFGSALAGTILVTVNPAYQADEVAYVLKQSRSAGIFLVPGTRGNPMLEHIEQVRGECPELREVIRFDQWDSFTALAEGSGDDLPTVKPEDPVMIQYTSGTTGFPKGALLHHRGLVNNGAHVLDRMGVQQGATWITSWSFQSCSYEASKFIPESYEG